MFKKMSIMAAVVVFALAPVAQAVDIDINDDLVPDSLVAGNVFNLAFVTSQSVTQGEVGVTIPSVMDSDNNTDINYYNMWVTDFANNYGSTGNLVAGKGWDWKIIGSTSGTSAKNNTALGASTPLYNVNGGLIATGSDDLWDGSILIPMNTTETGGNNEQEVSTGTQTNGDRTNNPLGSHPSRGHGGDTDGDWIYKTDNSDANSKVYAMSEELTVTGTRIPEPATMSLLVMGGLGVLARRRRRRA